MKSPRASNPKPPLPPILVAPSEPPALKLLGQSHTLPETVGADYVCFTPNGLAGVQRKQFPGDFIASTTDDRLYRELPQMRAGLTFSLLLLEGRPSFTTSGALNYNHGRPQTLATLSKLFFTIMLIHQIPILLVDNQDQTAVAIQAFFSWCCEKEHSALMVRPGPKGGQRASDRDWQKHCMQSFPGIGPTQAEKIIDLFGGLPFDLKPGAIEKIKTVDRMNEKTTKRIERIFNEQL